MGEIGVETPGDYVNVSFIVSFLGVSIYFVYS